MEGREWCHMALDGLHALVLGIWLLSAFLSDCINVCMLLHANHQPLVPSYRVD